MTRKVYLEGTMQVQCLYTSDLDDLSPDINDGEDHSVIDVEVESTSVIDSDESEDYKIVELELSVILNVEEGANPIAITQDSENWFFGVGGTVINSLDFDILDCK